MPPSDFKLEKGKALIITGPCQSGKTLLAEAIAAQHGTFESINEAHFNSHFGLGGTLSKEPNTVIVDNMNWSTSLTYLRDVVRADKIVCHRQCEDDREVATPNFIFVDGNMRDLPFMLSDIRWLTVLDTGDM